MLQPFTGAKDAGILPEKSTKRPLDKGVLITFILLLLTGLVVLYAASFYNAQDKGSPLAELHSQLLCVAVGAVGMLVILKIDYRWLARPAVSGSLLLISLILLILVAIPGVGKMLNGSRRWLRVGPVSFQPSELAKYSMILFMARALSGSATLVSSPKYASDDECSSASASSPTVGSRPVCWRNACRSRSARVSTR